ncbi:MAG: D-alanyl-D-alanine carboxypeptidase family protein [Candidatus Saccharimonas sp.]
MLKRIAKITLVVGVACLIIFAMLVGKISEQIAANECQIQQGDLPSKIPERLNSVFTAAAKMYNVPSYVVALAYYSENGLSYRAPAPPYGKGAPPGISSAGARGYFQFLPGTFRMFRNSNPAHRPGNIYDLVDGAFAAAHYLAVLGARGSPAFGDPHHPGKGTVMWALGAYNAGPHSGFEDWPNHPYRIKAAIEYERTFKNASGATTLSAMITVCDNQDNSGTDDTPSFSAGCPSSSTSSTVRTGNGTRIKVCRIHGMVVNARIATKWQYLVQQAKADGINLTGGGFRTAAQQISLRRAHCGSSHYAIYQTSSRNCRPPTARPGESNHETALAVDLNNARTYGTRVYRWMRVHAPRLGIYARVPGEPWHWSLGGH